MRRSKGFSAQNILLTQAQKNKQREVEREGQRKIFPNCYIFFARRGFFLVGNHHHNVASIKMGKLLTFHVG